MMRMGNRVFLSVRRASLVSSRVTLMIIRAEMMTHGDSGASIENESYYVSTDSKSWTE